MACLRNNFNASIAIPRTYFNVEKNKRFLTFKFKATQSNLFSYSKNNNDDLWKASVCEVFLDLGDEFYYEFEVAPNGAIFVAKIHNRVIEFFKCDFFTSKTEIKGKTYYVTMTIDLAKLRYPKSIRYNAFRVETNQDKNEQNLSALNPTLCETFHIREKFIMLEL